MNNKKLIASMLAVSGLALAGCHPFVKYPHTAFISSTTAAGTAAGAATGGIIDAGIAVGAVAGFGIGTYLHSTPHWLKVLQKDGVQVIQTGHLVTIVIPSDRIFIIDTDSLSQHKYFVLDDVTSFIQNYGNVHIVINAYTDDLGSAATALNLSKAQAKSVASYMWAHGIPSDHITTEGHGQSDYIADNIDPRGRAWNRRIEIKFAYS